MWIQMGNFRLIIFCLFFGTFGTVAVAGSPKSPNTKLNELGFDKILFIKRPTFDSDHFYTDFINGCTDAQFRKNNGIYFYNLKICNLGKFLSLVQ